MTKKTHRAKRGTPSDSAVLDDGTLIEQLYDPETERSRFAIRTTSETREAKTYRTTDRRTVHPYSAENNLIAHGVVLFPSAVGGYDPGTRDGLVREIVVVHV